MKKNFIRNILILTFALTAFSCSNLIEPLQQESESKTAYIKLSLGSDRVSRTVIPTWDEVFFTDLVLKGTKQGGTEETLGSWASVSDMQNAALPVTTGSWTFTLTAKQGGTAFSGTTSKNITVGENSLPFKLTITSFGTESGSFDIALIFRDAPHADKVTKAIATLENLDGSAVAGTSSQNLTPVEKVVIFSSSGIATGIYRAKVIFYATEDGIDFELATWRELVQISSSLTSTANRTIESFDDLYTINYSLNGGALADGESLQETVTRKSAAITLPDLTRDYYIFDGWYTTENFADGTEVTSLSNFTGNISVYAKFTPVTFTITYVLNGGTNAEGAVTTYTVEDNVTLLEPEKGEEAFGGFYYASDFSGSMITGWNAGDKHENVTLYAKWDGTRATAENILEKIAALTESTKLKVTGVLSDYVISGIPEALKQLYASKPEILVSLDLSGTTGLTEISKQYFLRCYNLEEIVLPDTITVIRAYGFSYCEQLKEITIPESITSIEKSAFGNCTNLKIVTFPDAGIDVALRAFSGSSNITDVIIKDGSRSPRQGLLYKVSSSIANLTIYSMNGKTLKYYFDVGYASGPQIPETLTQITIKSGEIPEKAFYECSNIKSVMLSEGVTSIGNSALYGCTSLETITIPEGITGIGSSAFQGCTSLETITIPEGVSSIGGSTFYGCTSLDEIILPEGVTGIGRYAFGNCTSLETIIIPNGVTSIGEYAFSSCKLLKTVTMPEGLTSIDYQAFVNCTLLKTITIPASVTSIAFAAFSGCESLETMTIPEGVTSIEGCTFYHCKSLKTIIIPETVTKIEYSVFAECTSLVSVNLPNGITEISDTCFSGCSNLETINIPAGVTKINYGAFKGCSKITRVSIPAATKYIGKEAFKDISKTAKVTFGTINLPLYYSTSKPTANGTGYTASGEKQLAKSLSNASTNPTAYGTWLREKYCDYYLFFKN